jgi:hypothetical protein
MATWAFAPSRGFAGHRLVGAGSTEFISLGPIAEGGIIRRVRVATSASADAASVQWQFQGAVCSSPSGTDANIVSGFGFVDVSDLPAVAGRAARLDNVAEMFHVLEFFPGLLVRSGSMWVVCRVTNGGIVGVVNSVVTVEVWRGVRVGES